MFARIVFYFVFEPVTRAAAAGPGRVAALDHEVVDHAMKEGAVIKFFAREKNEIVHRFRRVLGEEIAHDFPARCFERGGVLLVGIDHHRRRRGIFFRHGEGKYEVSIKNGARDRATVKNRQSETAATVSIFRRLRFDPSFDSFLQQIQGHRPAIQDFVVERFHIKFYSELLLRFVAQLENG